MARHKKIETEAQEDPEMNISSMIDCCFLLLIYFLVATSLVSEKKLDINIPGSESAPSTVKPKVDPGKITVRADGSIYWNRDLQVGDPYDPSAKPGTPAYRDQRQMDGLVEQLKLLKEQATALDTNPVVMVSGASEAPHQRVVDVMGAMAEAGIHSVGLSTMADE